MDFRYIEGAGKSNLKYRILLRDGLTSCTRLMPHSNFHSEALMESLSKWIALIGSTEQLFFDIDPLFIKASMEMIINESFIKQDFSQLIAHGLMELWNECRKSNCVLLDTCFRKDGQARTNDRQSSIMSN